MMKKLPFIVLALLVYSTTYAQTVTELYQEQKFEELAKYENKADQLTAEELYMVGFAFFRLENDKKAIDFYDKAMDKGLDNGGVHFYKGLSLRFLEKFKDAIKEINIAIEKEPGNQEYLNEKGMIYYELKEFDKALEAFNAAKKLSTNYPQTFYWAARTCHEKKDFKNALAGYYEALDYLDKKDHYYLASMMGIGQLEYTYASDYAKSIRAYRKAVLLAPDEYEIYYKLIKSYNAAKSYTKADSVFLIVQKAFEAKKLPKEDMEIKTIPVAEFKWKDQTAIVRRSLADPKETLDISYKVFLLNKEGDQVVRRFMVEKTMQLEKNGPNHLLCEKVKETGEHITYPFGWVEDQVPLESLQKAVLLVLDEKMKPGASSTIKN